MPALAQAPASPPSAVDPLPPDTGTAGLQEMLLRLKTTARLMQTTAHPDDEDGGMLTLESRGKGEATLLMTLTRGEGGQNKVGSNLFDVLGVLRTLELTASDRYYGVEQRFSRVADFGYSKNPDETFQKWGGHDIPLSDMVRVIRTFRPDVLIARFSGTDRDGHGHHQASAILTKEAFRAAADPKRFPEQIKEGLQPWQARKLYIGNVCGFGASSCPAENYTVRLNTGSEESAARHVVHPVRDVRIAAPTFAGRRRLDGRARRSLHLLQAGGFGLAAGYGQRWSRKGLFRWDRYQSAEPEFRIRCGWSQRAGPDREQHRAGGNQRGERSGQRGCALTVRNRLARPP